jgi:hypothetical protein
MPERPPEPPEATASQSAARVPSSGDEPAPQALQERPTPMLEVHPHPLHGAITWRDFFIHIVIVAIGLGLAISLQQLVEYLHHRHQVGETRRALAQERAENRRTLGEQTRAWRQVVAELQNNLLVFDYLRQHPGTPQESLPGVLLWHVSELSFKRAAWDAARQSGVIALMPREEIERYSELYEYLSTEWEMAYQAVLSVIEAERYDLVDSDPSHLAPAQIAAEIDLIQAALGKQWLQASSMVNLVEDFPDFPATVSRAELARLRHGPDEQTRKLLAPARAQTLERLKAAAVAEPDSSASQTTPQ